MKHILLIATGGTIACRESGRGLAPITGAQKPMGEPGSDAERNMLDSFRVACSGWTGVAAVLHGQIIRGNHVVKVNSRAMNAFRSINAPLAGTIRDDGKVLLNIPPMLGGEPRFVDIVDSSFVVSQFSAAKSDFFL